VSPTKVGEFIDFVRLNFEDSNTFLLRCLRPYFGTHNRTAGAGLPAFWRLHGKDVVRVASSPAIFGTSADCIIDSGTSRFFHSVNVTDAFVYLYFHGGRVQLTHYSITSAPGGRGAHHLRSWVVEGFDGGTWVELDRRERDTLLNDSSAVNMFAVRRLCAVNQIRLKPTGINDGHDYSLMLSAIEVFGRVARGTRAG
jgi:hypothetical protein